jgi:hypothetical protein
MTATCTCPMTDPSTWERYGGAIEPGSVHEPDPECRACFTDDERAHMFTRPLSDECRLGYPEACTDVAHPPPAPRDRVACHGDTHVATF